MLQRSAARCREWHAQGVDVTVSVGLLFDSWADVRLATRVRQIVEKEEVPPGSVVLNLAEPAVDTEGARALENLARLRVDGFGLALDDFGSGAMELDKLARVAFTHMRVRRSFVAGADRDESARAGLAVALDLATRLKLRTIADGLATKEEWTLLQGWGCRLGQGPLVSGALAADAVPEWTRRWTASRVA
jgi:EAL domain-containing protein (putative c-di-GMP-specific phosphodiesterase class I)